MKTIFFFVKFFKNEQYAKDFIGGKVFANRLSYFKRIEGNEDFNRTDKHEGVIGWFQPGRGRFEINGMDITGDLAGPVEMQRKWLDDLNVFCVYAAHSGDLDLGNLSTENIDAFRSQLEIPDDCLKLGKFAVVVKDVAGFISRVETSVKSENYRVFRGFVKYYNPESFHGNFSDGEAIFRKRDEHKHQQEYRFVIDTLIKGTNPVTLNIGDIRDITMRFNSADINKDFLGGKIELKLS